MTDIVKAPPFMPSKPQWDATVKLLERALEELAQAQAERDAARAEVARLTAARIHLAELWRDFLNNRDSIPAGLALRDETIRVLAAALSQPAPAQPLDDDGVCKCGHARGQHRGVCMIFPCKCMEFTAPAQGQG